MNVTDNEKAMLRKIAESEYQSWSPEDEEIIGYSVWTFSVASSKADGGTLTSLQTKGLVRLSSYSKPGDCVEITRAGFEALHGK